MDDKVLELTKDNHTQRKNRFFIQSDPKALLIVEFARENKDEILSIAVSLEKEMREAGKSFFF